MTVADYMLTVGFVAAFAGVAVEFSIGWACIVGGITLIAAGARMYSRGTP